MNTLFRFFSSPPTFSPKNTTLFVNLIIPPTKVNLYAFQPLQFWQIDVKDIADQKALFASAPLGEREGSSSRLIMVPSLEGWGIQEKGSSCSDTFLIPWG